MRAPAPPPDLPARLDGLQSALSAALRDLPGAHALYLFGSRAAGRGDGYSDLDLQVVTTDLAASVAARHAALAPLGPLALEWPIERAADRCAATLLFARASHYHKVDLGFIAGAGAALADLPAGLAAPAVALWTGNRSPAALPPAPGPAYLPEPGTPGHLLTGQLLGAVRYVKARKRGQPLTCWRFAAAAVEALAGLLHARAVGAAPTGRRPTTWEYAALDALLDRAERDTLLAALDFSTPAATDRNLHRLLTHAAALVLADRALPPDERPALAAVTHDLLAFIGAELAVA